jgi:hypothetical protein
LPYLYIIDNDIASAQTLGQKPALSTVVDFAGGSDGADVDVSDVQDSVDGIDVGTESIASEDTLDGSAEKNSGVILGSDPVQVIVDAPLLGGVGASGRLHSCGF